MIDLNTYTALDNYQMWCASTSQIGTEDQLTILTYLALGLNGEAGEVADNVKRIIRDDGGKLTPERKSKIVLELGDTLWYLSRLADEIGVYLSAVALANIRKLEDRRKRQTINGEGDNR